MKNLKQFIFATIGLLLFASPAVQAVQQATHLAPFAATAVVALSALILYHFPTLKNTPTVFTAGIEKEIWAQYIIDRFWKDNQFLKRAFSDDDKVLAGKIVHIPQPGAAPIVTKNRNSFPAVAVRRTDTDLVYVLDEYTTAPAHIEDAEKYEVSYDKINSVYGDHAGYLVEYVASDLIVSKWLDETVSNVTKKFTTGGPTAATTAATTTAATGNRYAFHHKDLKKCQLQMNADNVPKMDRQALLESNMLDQFTDSLSDTQSRQFSEYYNATEGIVGRLYGFDILERSDVAVAASNNAIKALGAAGATGDSAVSLVWQKDAVARAMGTVKFFENLDRPEYYGDIYSALVRVGGRRRRADNKGVIALIQAPSA